MKKTGLVVKPKICGSDIVVQMDPGNEEGARRIMNTWGNTFPVIKIDEYIVAAGELVSFDLEVRVNSLPRFSFRVDDHALNIRKSLEKDLDMCTINVGFKTFRLKFDGIITKTFSDAGSSIIDLEGFMWVDTLYQVEQKVFKEMQMLDIFKYIMEKTSMGLYIIENEYLTAKHPLIMNPSMNYLDFFIQLHEKYSENIWCVDPLYYFHIGNIEKLRARGEDFDEYSLDNMGEKKKNAPLPIVLNSYQYPPGDREVDYDEDDKMVRVDYYTIDTNYSEVYSQLKSEYYKNDELVPTNGGIGTGNETYVTFPGNGDNDGFMSSIFPYYNERVNKLIGGTLIKVSTKNLVIELSPFDIVDFKCYLPRTDNLPIREDPKHSGAKIVIGYGYHFSHATDDVQNPTVVQTIDLI